MHPREWIRHPLTWSLLVAVLAVGGYLAAEVYLLDGGIGFPLDDSWIHLTFARNLAMGRGLSYEPGRLVTGSTSPLWTGVLALAFALPGSPLWWAKTLGVACYLLLVPATYRLGRELALPRGFAALAAVLTALSSWVVWSALSGMEILLFTLLSVVGMTLHLRERRVADTLPRSGLVLALAALARPEGFLLLGLAALDRGIAIWKSEPSDRRARLRSLGLWLLVAAVLLLPTLAFYRAVGGSFLPTTFSAKSAGIQRWMPSTGYVHVVLGILMPSQPITTLLAFSGALLLLWREIRRSSGESLPALWVLGLPLAYSLISPLGAGVLVGNLGRYFFPLLAVVAVLGLVAAYRLMGEPGGKVTFRPGLGLALAVLICLPTGIDWAEGVDRYTRCVLNIEDGDVAMAHWLADRVPPDAVLAVNDIGAMGYFLPNPLLDLAGITNPEIRDYFAGAQAEGKHWRVGVSRFLADNRPDYLVVFPVWFPELLADPSYRELRRIRIQGNIAMGEDELALYATPWTRHPLRSR